MARTPKQEAEFWLHELRDLSPEVRYLIWRDGSKEDTLRPKRSEFPRLVVEDEETGKMTCPHCGSTLYYHDLYVAFVSEIEYIEPEEVREVDEVPTIETYTPSSEDTVDWVAVECQRCDQPVSIPAGWDVATDA